jgi:hypothetical protein
LSRTKRSKFTWTGFAPALLLSFAAPAAALQGDEASLLRTARAIADATSGQRVGNGGPTDKIVYFGRNGQGQIVVTSVAVLAPGADAVAPPAGALAMVRTRAAAPGPNLMPDPADLALARASGIPIFIVGEWRAPPIVWEIVRQGSDVRVRDVDPLGAAGPWRPAAL